MTIRELFREFVVGKQAAERTRMAKLTYVWLSVALPRQKKLPTLAEFIQHHGTQTSERQRMAMDIISARYGLPQQRVRLIRVQPNG